MTAFQMPIGAHSRTRRHLRDYQSVPVVPGAFLFSRLTAPIGRIRCRQATFFRVYVPPNQMTGLNRLLARFLGRAGGITSMSRKLRKRVQQSTGDTHPHVDRVADQENKISTPYSDLPLAIPIQHERLLKKRNKRPLVSASRNREWRKPPETFDSWHLTRR